MRDYWSAPGGAAYGEGGERYSGGEYRSSPIVGGPGSAAWHGMMLDQVAGSGGVQQQHQQRGGYDMSPMDGRVSMRAEDYDYEYDEASVDAWLSGSGTFGTAVSTPNQGVASGSWGRGLMGSSSYDQQQQQPGYASSYAQMDARNNAALASDPQQQYMARRWLSPLVGVPSASAVAGVASSSAIGDVHAPWPRVSISQSAVTPETWSFDPFDSYPVLTTRAPSPQPLPQPSVSTYQDVAYSAAPAAVAAPPVAAVEYDPPVAAPAPAPPALPEVAESGLDLHIWLAESVWNFCTTPYRPGKPCSPESSPKPVTNYQETFTPITTPTFGYITSKPAKVLSSGLGSMAEGYSSSEWLDTYTSAVHVSPPLTPSPATLVSNPFNLLPAPSQSFINFVHRTLSQTLLSPPAVILSLWYIRRMGIHADGNEEGVELRRMLRTSAMDQDGRGGEEAVRRVLTLGLACSNKWLDDNTFTNKSWSDVTRLPLAEINRLEMLAIGPLNFDLSVQAHEWRSWLIEVERQVTPFVTDSRIVHRALRKMAEHVRREEGRFDVEVVLPRLRAEREDLAAATRRADEEFASSALYSTPAVSDAWGRASLGDISAQVSSPYVLPTASPLPPSTATATIAPSATATASSADVYYPQTSRYSSPYSQAPRHVDHYHHPQAMHHQQAYNTHHQQQYQRSNPYGLYYPPPPHQLVTLPPLQYIGVVA